MKKILLFITLIVLFAALEANSSDESPFAKKHGIFVNSFSKAEKIILYKGLPRSSFDENVFKNELKSKKTVKLHGYYFYNDPKNLNTVDIKQLQDVYVTPNGFVAFRGEKFCGGFHPNYAIEWHLNNKVYRALICFGCKEMKSFGPMIELRCDIGDTTFRKFEDTLNSIWTQPSV